MGRELEHARTEVNGLCYRANTGAVLVPRAAPITTQSPSRLREGLGEGRPPNAPPRKSPSPDPSRKRKGSRRGRFAHSRSPANAGAQDTKHRPPSPWTPACAGERQCDQNGGAVGIACTLPPRRPKPKPARKNFTRATFDMPHHEAHMPSVGTRYRRVPEICHNPKRTWTP